MKKGMKQEDRPIPCDYYMAFYATTFFYSDPARYYEKNEVNQIGKHSKASKEEAKELSKKIPWK